ncbi:MAG: hypothetical protein ACP5KY_00395 [Thermoproteus sp.]
MELQEAVDLLEAKINSPTFVKAVGRTAAEAIKTLLEAYRCNVVLTTEEVLRVLNDYYIFESRMRRLIELYEELSGGALTALARITLGEDADLPDIDYKLLLRELDAYRSELFKLAEMVKEAERRCPKAYSSTSSKA